MNMMYLGFGFVFLNVQLQASPLFLSEQQTNVHYLLHFFPLKRERNHLTLTTICSLCKMFQSIPTPVKVDMYFIINIEELCVWDETALGGTLH